MRRSPLGHRVAHLRVLTRALLLSLTLAAATAAGVLADGGGQIFPH